MDDQTNDKGRVTTDGTKEMQQNVTVQESSGDLSGPEKAANWDQFIEMMKGKDPERSARIEAVAREIFNHFSAKDPNIITLFLLVVARTFNDKTLDKVSGTLDEILNAVFSDPGEDADSEGGSESFITDYASKMNGVLQTFLIDGAKIGGNEIPALVNAVRLVLDYSIPRIFENIKANLTQQITADEKSTSVKYKDSRKIKMTTDKFANAFFSRRRAKANTEKAEINKREPKHPLKYEGRKAKKEITLYYDYYLDKSQIEKLGLPEEFDGRAAMILSIYDNLLDEGNTIVSPAKVWHEMGNSGSPSQEHLKEIVAISELLSSTIVVANANQVYEAWGIEEDLDHVILSQLMPLQVLKATFKANGKIAKTEIRINGHSPFYIIGNAIGHITAWDKSILKAYKGKRTQRYYDVLRYLMVNIGWLRNDNSKRSNKITYSHLYKTIGETTPRDKQLCKDMLYKILDQVFLGKYIKSYKESPKGEDPGVEIRL